MFDYRYWAFSFYDLYIESVASCSLKMLIDCVGMPITMPMLVVRPLIGLGSIYSDTLETVRASV